MQLELGVVDEQRRRRVGRRRRVRDVAADRAAILRRDAAGLAARPRRAAETPRCSTVAREDLGVRRQRAEHDLVVRHADAAQLVEPPEADVAACPAACPPRAAPSGRCRRRTARHGAGLARAAPAPRPGSPARADRRRADTALIARGACLRARLEDGLEDPHVAGAAAEVAGERLRGCPPRSDCGCARAASPRRAPCPACRCRTARRRASMNACCTACSRSPSRHALRSS